MKKLALIICGILALVGVVYAAQDEPVISNGQAVWPQYYNGTNFRNPRVDGSTRSTIDIDYFHHEIHAGDAYFISGTTTIGSGVTSALSFAVPVTAKTPHLTLNVSAANVTNVYLMENTRYKQVNTNLVSGATPYNHDRNSINTSGCTIGWMPAWSNLQTGYTVSGTTLISVAFGSSGIGQTGIGGQFERENELILKSGTTYVMIFSSSAAGNTIGYALNWYEHTPEEN